MARPSHAVPDNAPGPFYVDDACIDCGACRWIAPAVFGSGRSGSRVHRQPTDSAQERDGWRALVACPVGAIGIRKGRRPEGVQDLYPRPVTDSVYHCGYHAETSYGAASWLIVRPQGNVLVDSPRFSRPLVRRIEALGGVSHMVLTHCDDVADHARFAAHFGCERILHAADQRPETAAVERLIEGREPVALADDLRLIPVPGHTRGSTCLLHGDVLFTGDHLAWDRARKRLTAFRGVCWYDWRELVTSMDRLATYRFAWVLPGHGAPVQRPAEIMAADMAQLLDRLHATL